jgi:hypothetical protein
LIINNYNEESNIIEQQKLFEIVKLFIDDIIDNNKIGKVLYYTSSSVIHMDYKYKTAYSTIYGIYIHSYSKINSVYK